MSQSTPASLPRPSMLTSADLPHEFVADVLARLLLWRLVPDGEAFVRAVLWSHSLDAATKERCFYALANREQLLEVFAKEARELTAALADYGTEVHCAAARGMVAAHLCFQALAETTPSPAQALRWAVSWMPLSPAAPAAQAAFRKHAGPTTSPPLTAEGLVWMGFSTGLGERSLCDRELDDLWETSVKWSRAQRLAQEGADAYEAQRFAEAIKAWRSAGRVLTVLICRRGRNDLRDEWAARHCHLANAFSRQGQWSAAMDKYTQGLAEYHALIEQHGRVDLRHERAAHRCNFADALSRQGQWSAAVVKYTDCLAELDELIEQKGRNELRLWRAMAVCNMAISALDYPDVMLPQLPGWQAQAIKDTTDLVFADKRFSHLEEWVRSWRLAAQHLVRGLAGTRLMLPEETAALHTAIHSALTQAPPLTTADRLLASLVDISAKSDTTFSDLPTDNPLRLAHTQTCLRWLQELLAESELPWLSEHAQPLEALAHALWQACVAHGTEGVAAWFFHTQGLHAQRRALWGHSELPEVQHYIRERQTLQSLQEQLLARQGTGRPQSEEPSADLPFTAPDPGTPGHRGWRSALLDTTAADNASDELAQQVTQQWVLCRTLREQLTAQDVLPPQAVVGLADLHGRLSQLARESGTIHAVCMVARGLPGAEGGAEAVAPMLRVLLLWATPGGACGDTHAELAPSRIDGQLLGPLVSADGVPLHPWQASSWLAHADMALDIMSRRGRSPDTPWPRRGVLRAQSSTSATAPWLSEQAQDVLAQVRRQWSQTAKPLAAWLRTKLGDECTQLRNADAADSTPCVHLFPADDLHHLPWHHAAVWPAEQLRVWPTLGDWLRHGAAPRTAAHPRRWALCAHAAMDGGPHQPLPMVALEAALTQRLWGAGAHPVTTLPHEVLAAGATVHWPGAHEAPIDVLLTSGHGGHGDPEPAPAQHPRRLGPSQMAGARLLAGRDSSGQALWLDAQTLSRIQHARILLMMACILGKTDDWLGEPLGPVASAFGHHTRLSLGCLVRVDDLAACLASLSLQWALKHATSPTWLPTVLSVQSGWEQGRWPDGFGPWLAREVAEVGPDLVPSPQKPECAEKRSIWCGVLQAYLAAFSDKPQTTVATVHHIQSAWSTLAEVWAEKVPLVLRQTAPYFIVLGDA